LTLLVRIFHRPEETPEPRLVKESGAEGGEAIVAWI
jgi:hypothetical protein